MAARTNNALLTLARPNKTPALQAIIDPNFNFLLFEPLNKMLALFKKFIVYTSTRNEIKHM